jgi:hypothetical protein
VSNSKFRTIETQNSSIRLIRPSLQSLPVTVDELNKSNLVLGLYIQPFGEREFAETTSEIPVVTGT